MQPVNQSSISIQQLGAYAESKFISKCLQYNISVSIPIFSVCRYDCVVDIQNRTYRVQIKSTLKPRSKNIYRFSLKQNSSKYSKNDFDYFVFYAYDINVFWVVPYEIIGSRRSYTLDINLHKNYLFNHIF